MTDPQEPIPARGPRVPLVQERFSSQQHQTPPRAVSQHPGSWHRAETSWNQPGVSWAGETGRGQGGEAKRRGAGSCRDPAQEQRNPVNIKQNETSGWLQSKTLREPSADEDVGHLGLRITRCTIWKTVWRVPFKLNLNFQRTQLLHSKLFAQEMKTRGHPETCK